MYGIFTYIYIWFIFFYGELIGKYASPMDAMTGKNPNQTGRFTLSAGMNDEQKILPGKLWWTDNFFAPGWLDTTVFRHFLGGDR